MIHALITIRVICYGNITADITRDQPKHNYMCYPLKITVTITVRIWIHKINDPQ